LPVGIEQQHVGGVGRQLSRGLVEQHAQGHAQVQAGRDGLIHRAQRRHAVELLLGLLVQPHAVDGTPGNLG
jgi:hypothetical protein